MERIRPKRIVVSAVRRALFVLFVQSRPYNALLPLIFVYIGAQIAGAGMIDIYIAMAVVVLVHSGATLLNDAEDIEVDRTNDVQPSKHNRRTLLVIVAVLVFIAVIVSAVFLPLSTTLYVCSVLLVSWLYDAKPFQLSRRPIASIVALGVCYGSLPMLLGLSLSGGVDSYTFLFALVVGVGRASLSMLKDYKDARGDALHNKRTFLLVYGRTQVRRVSVMLACIGYTGVVAYALLYANGRYVPIVLLALFGVYLIYERLQLNPNKSYSALNDKFHFMLHIELLFYIGVAVWLSI